jgi:hypothetical protein
VDRAHREPPARRSFARRNVFAGAVRSVKERAHATFAAVPVIAGELSSGGWREVFAQRARIAAPQIGARRAHRTLDRRTLVRRAVDVDRLDREAKPR